MSWSPGNFGKRGMLCASLLVLLMALPAVAETFTYKVDFGTGNSPLADGFQSAEAGTLQATCDPDFHFTDEKGLHPISLQFHGTIGAYSLGNAEKPLTTDGIYTFGSNGQDPMDIPFTVSGLPPKARVSFYAVRAWNGAGRAAFLSLGDTSKVDIAGAPDDDVDPKDISDFIPVSQKVVVGPTGKLEGVFSNSDGSVTRAEGQWGAMILVVETP